jgi:hypothetical protein
VITKQMERTGPMLMRQLTAKPLEEVLARVLTLDWLAPD